MQRMLSNFFSYGANNGLWSHAMKTGKLPFGRKTIPLFNGIWYPGIKRKTCFPRELYFSSLAIYAHAFVCVVFAPCWAECVAA